MNTMNDLPNRTTQAPSQPPGSNISAVGSVAKEIAPLSGIQETPLVTEIGKEVELPPEVIKAGVTVRADSIELPKPVRQLGVSQVGVSFSATTAPPSVSLPLSDEQIADGLHQSIITSWRWLAEWCVRQLKSAHIAFKNMHGAFVRVQE